MSGLIHEVPVVVCPAADALDATADLLEREGWCQRAFSTDDGRMCAALALTSTTNPSGSAANFTAHSAARAALCTVISTGNVMAWNDVPGRTKAEVVGAFREAARLARRS